jgi:hypothetical protein
MSRWQYDNGWRYRPWWLVAVNTVLRLFQPQRRKLVIYAIADLGPGRLPPLLLGHGFGLVEHV